MRGGKGPQPNSRSGLPQLSSSPPGAGRGIRAPQIAGWGLGRFSRPGWEGGHAAALVAPPPRPANSRD